MEPGRDVVPRQHFVLGPVPRDEPVGIETLCRHGIEPASELEVLRPLLKGAAGSPDALDDRTDPAVSP